ncbi:MAG: pyridoxamine 5'-phosphate oxidase [Candidatus Nanopelagicales bacterium]
MNEIRRVDYQVGPLLEQDLLLTPLGQFQSWLQEAATAGIEEPNAMAVATVDAAGQPHVRTILCKEVTAQGFVFFTNYTSDKARQIAQNPQVGLCFHWQPQHRQVRVTGIAARLPQEESDAYFASRPRDAQLGAWSSPQSSVIPDREYLRAHLADVTARFAHDVPRPDSWGGYVIRVRTIEFWQGQPSRLHDRLRMTARGEVSLDDPDGWRRERLAP